VVDGREGDTMREELLDLDIASVGSNSSAVQHDAKEMTVKIFVGSYRKHGPKPETRKSIFACSSVICTTRLDHHLIMFFLAWESMCRCSRFVKNDYIVQS